jgi:hypothetical protein
MHTITRHFINGDFVVSRGTVVVAVPHIKTKNFRWRLYKEQVLVHGMGFSPDRRTIAVISIGTPNPLVPSAH